MKKLMVSLLSLVLFSSPAWAEEPQNPPETAEIAAGRATQCDDPTGKCTKNNHGRPLTFPSEQKVSDEATRLLDGTGIDNSQKKQTPGVK